MPTPTPPPTPAPATPKHTRGQINKAQAAALDKSDQICLTAQKAAYAAALVARTITAAFVTQLSTDTLAARNELASAVQQTSGSATATVDETAAEDALLVAIHEVQAAARQKYARSQPTALAAYHIGARLDISRANLEQFSQDIISQLATDTLPGITPAKVTALTTLRTAYVGAQSTQSTAQSAAIGDHATLADQIHSITDRRMAIQFAADAQWPFTVDTNAGIRKEFSLPTTQPFNG